MKKYLSYAARQLIIGICILLAVGGLFALLQLLIRGEVKWK